MLILVSTLVKPESLKLLDCKQENSVLNEIVFHAMLIYFIGKFGM